MKVGVTCPRQRAVTTALVLASLGILVLVLTSCTQSAQPASMTPTVPTLPAQDVAPTPTPTPVPLRLLVVEPVKGYVGDQFTIAGQGLTPGKEIDLQWVTWDGAYATEAVGNDVQFHERVYKQKRVSLGRVTPDAQGRISGSFTVPEDYGEVHDIYGVTDGQDIAKGGYRVFRRATISPTEGPVGTPITITVTGLGWRPFESTMAVRYDNTYTGFVSATITGGTGVAHIRAAGPVGKRTIQLTAASPGVPFLNNQQSATAYIPNMDLDFTFTVTSDAGPPVSTMEWPDPARVAQLSSGAVPTTVAQPGVLVALAPDRGPVMTSTTLRASGLPPSIEVALLWVTGRGTDAQGYRNIAEVPITRVTTAADGSLTVPFQITDDRGGWQFVWLVQGDKVLAELPFYVERSVVGVTPLRVKAGEKFTVQIKGGGWTELDKGVAVTYDNAYIGYACSVTSSGDVTINLTATGGPGTHLIDLYPMVYRHQGTHPAEYWNFELPQLTALRDHPGLALGYRLPIVRLAVEVTE